MSKVVGKNFLIFYYQRIKMIEILVSGEIKYFF